MKQSDKRETEKGAGTDKIAKCCTSHSSIFPLCCSLSWPPPPSFPPPQSFALAPPPLATVAYPSAPPPPTRRRQMPRRTRERPHAAAGRTAAAWCGSRGRSSSGGLAPGAAATAATSSRPRARWWSSEGARSERRWRRRWQPRSPTLRWPCCSGMTSSAAPSTTAMSTRGKYLSEYSLPENIVATTSASEALAGANFCFHAVPVQFSSSFLESISTYVDPKLPFISLSKGLELNTLRTMSQIIPLALGNPRQPFIVLSGPSFAVELMEKLPTAMVVASKDRKLASAVQQLLASSNLRISTSSDVTGVEIAGALKNVLAIAAGIVEGMHLGNNCMAALVAQGCSEIRWLATKMGAKPTTLSGLSGSGDIMLTCFVNLSRNRNVGLRLGSGEKLDEILNSMNQVAEGVSTAGAVIALAQKYNVKLPVLTAVARIIDNELTPKRAVMELMNLPQVEEV
ncbi:glycerol-3-phosphate dehydrogenase [NAD(+)], chloroplastic isoform X3 [Triticum aestivum]|uniref:glycerol-3-phosphate dehydrogenase [NAD(+)], chloroplastic isoform X3 n=1 Tax=Triticum aestivum TaxID=4565 RepID=UPI001D01027D|nr:glycerol-3-phosphate dehydrogenase [NAD(+)], chloroplastic-like isoform X3 [Triticum aestivum]